LPFGLAQQLPSEFGSANPAATSATSSVRIIGRIVARNMEVGRKAGFCFRNGR
jgi:hypothetical protein